MEYVRTVNSPGLNTTSTKDSIVQYLLDRESGSQHCTIAHIQTLPGGGSRAGLHTHPVDQIYYVLSGSIGLEIEGKEYQATPGTLVVIPAGVPHRNWNSGSEPSIHLAFNTPLPDPNVPFAQTVGS
jgi:quercetin dioxygenase-like cupin family protein